LLLGTAYYNENDRQAAAWLRQLIADDLIAPGFVDERSICDVKPSDLHGYTQHHFFAGIGGWSAALRRCGWPDDVPVWTGSCPCQSLSVAGLKKGHEDERHLWPEFARLICECQPAIIFGEQVASKLGREWLSGVRLDLEEMGYAVGADDLCAAGIGAPHLRQRLWWLADLYGKGLEGRIAGELPKCAGEVAARESMSSSWLSTWHRCRDGKSRRVPAVWPTQPCVQPVADGVPQGVDGVGHGSDGGSEKAEAKLAGWPTAKDSDGTKGTRTLDGVMKEMKRRGVNELSNAAQLVASEQPTNNGALVPDPKLFPLSESMPGRVGLLKGAGNAIVVPLACEFIDSAMEAVIDQCRK